MVVTCSVTQALYSVRSFLIVYFFFGKWLFFVIEIPISETHLSVQISDENENILFSTGYIPKAWICKTLSLHLDK